jgi:hypothetical protein
MSKNAVTKGEKRNKKYLAIPFLSKEDENRKRIIKMK